MSEQIRYRHLRTASNGCVTVCAIMGDSMVPERLGFAFCSPRDQFSRRIGRIKSFGRASSESYTTTNLENIPEIAEPFNTGFTAGIISFIDLITSQEKRISSQIPQWLSTKFWPAWKRENPRPERPEDVSVSDYD